MNSPRPACGSTRPPRRDGDLDLDLHDIWRESAAVPAVPPCLGTDSQDPAEKPPNLPACHSCKPCHIEYFFRTHASDRFPFEWLGPDPLSPATRADELFFTVLASCLPRSVSFLEFRLVRVDPATEETIAENLFFLPRVETVMGNLRRLQVQMLEIIHRPTVGTNVPFFRLLLRPFVENPLCRGEWARLPYMEHATGGLLLDSTFFVQNLVLNYR